MLEFKTTIAIKASKDSFISDDNKDVF